MSDVTIIGAGVAGLWAAYALRKDGADVRLIDRNGPPGPHGCSWWAGGMLAPHCEGAVSEQAVIDHGRQAEASWEEITPIKKRGSLVVALERDRRELDRFARRTEAHRRLNANDLAELEPELSAHKDGLFFETESHLDPRHALVNLVAVLRNQGVDIEQADVTPNDVDGTIIDARGMASDAPGLRGVRGEMVVLRAPDIHLSRPVRLLHPRHPLYIVPRDGGIYMLGATQIESISRGAPTARSILELLSAAYALDPRFGEAEVLETGADLRPAFADNVPRVKPRGRVVHLNGLFRHGYLMAPALAKQARDYILHGQKGDLVRED
ncbi:MAG: FAD-dependent oxidoreductase [Marinovum sp.]|nr:FAD-dependent oxidoreductase [Marinovum sp.]